MNGYRTIVVGLISVLGGVLTALGYTIPEETLQSLTDSLTALVGAGMTLYGVVMVVLRMITKGPVGPLGTKGPAGVPQPKTEEKDPHDPTV